MSYFLPLKCHLFQPSNITIPNVLVNKNTKGKHGLSPILCIRQSKLLRVYYHWKYKYINQQVPFNMMWNYCRVQCIVEAT